MTSIARRELSETELNDTENFIIIREAQKNDRRL